MPERTAEEWKTADQMISLVWQKPSCGQDHISYGECLSLMEAFALQRERIIVAASRGNREAEEAVLNNAVAQARLSAFEEAATIVENGRGTLEDIAEYIRQHAKEQSGE